MTIAQSYLKPDYTLGTKLSPYCSYIGLLYLHQNQVAREKAARFPHDSTGEKVYAIE